jgi:3'-phosphoadenosine 5'-phosphosulfate sulfotransferase (PAPS reductase)/FAD synthetase
MSNSSPVRSIDRIHVAAPVVLAYGVGVDSTAILVELEARGQVPDLVLTADTGTEKPETYEYQAMIADWMAARGIWYHVVQYTPQRFKHWPPYFSLLENVLTNATLPSISLGRHSCSLKWKVSPQDAYLRNWEPARAVWRVGGKVTRLIGYDAGPADTRRHAHASSIANDLYECRYP